MLFLGCLARALETDRTLWLKLAVVLPLATLAVLSWSIHGRKFSFDATRESVRIESYFFGFLRSSDRTIPFAEIASLKWVDDSETGGQLKMRLQSRRTYNATGSRKKADSICQIVKAN